MNVRCLTLNCNGLAYVLYAIYQDHSQYALTYGLMLGIRVMVSSAISALSVRQALNTTVPMVL